MSSDKMPAGGRVPECDRGRGGLHTLKTAMGLVMLGLGASLMFQVICSLATYNSENVQAIATLRERVAVLESRGQDMFPERSVTDYYNYYDELAQSICTASTNQPLFIFAIRRDCRPNGDGLMCNAMCKSRRAAMISAMGNQGSTSECFDAVHVYKNRPVLSPDHETDAGKVGLAAYRYYSGGCTWRANHCGPNYCCCRLRP
ncbi:Hypp7657 [Branchiostoma lanceolatum]|uniref:Hypp7657 protein n=1 Tax=Branchiostoma lanceolatum TaxID=7740 RepID=A0A8J9Z1W2_BRALA|nr:Hypp7657 [Branchiostoma lanceolatum]